MQHDNQGTTGRYDFPSEDTRKQSESQMSLSAIARARKTSDLLTDVAAKLTNSAETAGEQTAEAASSNTTV